MVDEDKVLHLFNKVHGPLGPAFEAVVYYDEWGSVGGVRIMKDKGIPLISSEYSLMEIIVDALCLDMGGSE